MKDSDQILMTQRTVTIIDGEEKDTFYRDNLIFLLLLVLLFLGLGVLIV